MNGERRMGQVDIPLDPARADAGFPQDDQLQITEYYEGLATFITRCQTPMTIAVQGDWGSGKTTALNFVKHTLTSDPTSKVELIEFNTWQYSQFDLGDTLIFSMIHEIMKPLVSVSGKARESLQVLVRIAGAVASSTARHAGTVAGVGFLTNPIVDSLQETAAGGDGKSLATQIKELRSDFAAAIQEYCDKREKERIIILIDDLDRVKPERAVEVMEVLKVFFDIPRCVFVLAIDFEVVRRGVNAKFGDSMDSEKARSFFDKIIQVPFQMPVDQYEARELLAVALRGIGAVAPGGAHSDYERFFKAAEHSIGNNPRSVKRLINTFELLKVILEKRAVGDSTKIDDLVLFMLLCAQTAYEGFHQELLRQVSHAPQQIVRVFDDALQSDDDVSSSEGAEAAPTLSVKDLRRLDLGALGPEDRARRFGVKRVDRPRFTIFLKLLGQALADAGGSDHGIEPVLRSHVKLTAIASIGETARVDHEVRQPSTTTEERDSRIRRDTDDETLQLFHRLHDAVRDALDGQPFSTSVLSGQVVSFYAHDDVSAALKIPVRLRPKFLGVSYSRHGLRLHLGRAVGRASAGDARYSSEWKGLAEGLEASFPSREDVTRGVYFRKPETGSPLLLGGIQSGEDIASVAPYLREIHALATQGTARSE